MAPFVPYIVAASAILSLIALAAACYALLRAETPRLIACEKVARDAQIDCAGMADSLSTMRDTIKRINSRTAMRELRAKKPGERDDGLPDPQQDPEGWRAAMQRKYPRGVFDYNGRA